MKLQDLIVLMVTSLVPSPSIQLDFNSGVYETNKAYFIVACKVNQVPCLMQVFIAEIG